MLQWAFAFCSYFSCWHTNAQAQIKNQKHQSSAALAIVRGIHWWQLIPRTKGQLHGKRFHLMTSSCTAKDVMIKNVETNSCMHSRWTINNLITIWCIFHGDSGRHVRGWLSGSVESDLRQQMLFVRRFAMKINTSAETNFIPRNLWSKIMDQQELSPSHITLCCVGGAPVTHEGKELWLGIDNHVDAEVLWQQKMSGLRMCVVLELSLPGANVTQTNG